MTQNEIIEMANEAGNGDEEWLIIANQLFKHFPEEMQRFAKVVAQHEREACAKIVETLWDTPTNGMATEEQSYGDECAKAIRARGQA